MYKLNPVSEKELKELIEDSQLPHEIEECRVLLNYFYPTPAVRDLSNLLLIKECELLISRYVRE